MITLATESHKEQWNDYVDQHYKGTFFHLYEWKQVIDESIKHKTYYLVAKNGENIEGLLPLTHVKSFLFGNNLVSNPFCVYGGILADSEEVEKKLFNYAKELAVKLGVDSLELRNLDKSAIDLPTKDLYCTFIKELSTNNDENLKAIPRKQRAMVRKGIKFNLTYRVDQHIDDFCLAYETSVRNLGTPVFSRKYFKSLKKYFDERCDIVSIIHENKVVSSVMSFYYKDTVYPYYGGGTFDARKVAANDFMYWSLMEHSVSKGIRFFDFGRSKVETGAYFFKKNWGFEPRPLFYQYYLNTVESIPEVNPLNPKYQLFIKAWKKLPLPITRIVGPVLSRNLG